jgi:ABC-type sugar transport system permease subunit
MGIGPKPNPLASAKCDRGEELLMSLDSVSKDTIKSPRQLGLSHRAQDNLTIFLFLLPGLILFLVFVTYPIFRSIYFSLFDWNGFGPAEDFIGLDNFTRILTDKIFIKAVKNGILIVLL